MPGHNSTADLIWTHTSGAKLYLGSLAAAQDAKHLQDLQVTKLVTCMLEPPAVVNESVQRHHVEIGDGNNVSITPFLEKATAQIETWLATGLNVLVHCSSGISRSATVMLGYLISYKKPLVSLLDTYIFVKNARSCINPGTQFLHDLQELEVKVQQSTEPSMTLVEYYAFTVQGVVEMYGATATLEACIEAVRVSGYDTDMKIMAAAQSFL